MSGYSYAPARAHDWLAVATAGRLLVAKTSDDADQVAALAATAAPEMSVQQVLEVLTSKGLAATGPFALLFWVDGDLSGQGLGVILRGDARVTVETTDGPTSVSSRGVTTWTEQVLEGATGFTVEVDVAATQSASLPLAAGAVWASRIQLSNSNSPGSAAASTVSSSAASSSTASTASTAASVASTPALAESAPVASAPPEAPSPASGDAAPVDESTRVFQTSTRSADAPAAPAEAAEPEGYDYLFGATVFRPVGAAAGKAPKPDASAAPDELPVPAFLDPSQPASHGGEADAVTRGDHDGRTVLASDISAARQQARSNQQQTPAPARPQAHSYLIQLPDGTSQPLSAPVILGRAPSVSNVPASVLPHLVTLAGDDISRSHVRVAVEGDTVVVTDLHSSNGTHVIAPGKLPQLLRAGEPTPVITGTTIDLGSDVLLHVTEA